MVYLVICMVPSVAHLFKDVQKKEFLLFKIVLAERRK